MKEFSLFEKIREEVRKIPLGKVSTYGAIAKKVGIADARKVGWAVYGNSDKTVPCHRVVNKEGFLAEKFSLGGWKEQKARLEAEGITFIKENQVDLKKHLV